jgi:hypothetical protein
MAHAYDPSYRGGRGSTISVQANPRQKHKTLYEKLVKAKRAGSMSQVVEQVQCEALSSNPSTTKKKPPKQK